MAEDAGRFPFMTKDEAMAARAVTKPVEVREECAACDGSGFDPLGAGETCLVCGGQGRLPAPRSMRTCVVYRTQAKSLKPNFEQSNYNDADAVQFEACQFSDGRVAQRWLTPTGSMVWWDDWEALCRVHVYVHPDYGTKVVWSDGEVQNL
jgi:hypothetical protein